MSEPYFPPGTIMGPPDRVCESVLAWSERFSKNAKPLLGSVWRSGDLDRFVSQHPMIGTDFDVLAFLCDDRPLALPIQDIEAWLPLVPLERREDLPAEESKSD